MAESTKVERWGCGTVGDLGLWKDAFIPGLKRISDFIQARGAVSAIQIGHSGRKARLTRFREGQQPQTPDHPDMFDWLGGRGAPSLGLWLAFYNDERPHPAPSYRTPREVFESEACEYVDNASTSLRYAHALPTCSQAHRQEKEVIMY